MHTIVPNLIALASIVALVPAVARAETPVTPVASTTTASICAGFNVQECLAEASCSFAVAWCKDQARECRALATATSVPSPSASAKAVTPTPALPPGGEWIQNEYWPEACYFVDHQQVLCESDLTDAQLAALGMSFPSSPESAAQRPNEIATPLDCGERPPEDCAILEPLNDPGAIVNCAQWQRRYRECMSRAASHSAAPAPPAPARSTPDCARLVNENHPDCRP